MNGLPLLITYDTGKIETADVDEVLAWREWSQREADMIASVATGDKRRFYTSRNGISCDIERTEAQS